MNTQRRNCVLALTVLGFSAAPADGQVIGPEKKIIAYKTTVRGLRAHIETMEGELPAIDGVIIYPPASQSFFTGRHRLEDYRTAIEQLQDVRTRARKYTHNFMQSYLTTGDKEVLPTDWFDPEFEDVVNNWKVGAEFCKRSGLVGILFDDEVYYGTNLWTYRGLKHEKTKSAKEYADQVFRRGAQIMRAINTVYPDIHILILNGPSSIRLFEDDARYALVRHFVDGLLSQCTGGAQIICGYERGYGYRTSSQFSAARRLMKEKLLSLSRVPEKFQRHFRAAFPFYFIPAREYGLDDNENLENMSPAQAAEYFIPEEFEYALHQALKYSDEYVWIYREGSGPDLWNRRAGRPYLAAAYREAFVAARRPHPRPPMKRKLPTYLAPAEKVEIEPVGAPISEGKKVYVVVGPNRTPRMLREQVAWMEKRAAFDGVLVYPGIPSEHLQRQSDALGRLFRMDRRNRIEDFRQAIEDLQAAHAKAKQYRHNFLLTYQDPVDTGDRTIKVPDWFDTEFDTVINNWQVAADFCRQSGLVGIHFTDTAWHSTDLWTHKGLKYEKTRSAGEYADQVFLRGAQIMRAVNTVYPDIRILAMNGPSRAGFDPDPAAPHALMRAFFDGLLSECTGAARIIDGHQMGWGYRSPVAFASARRVVRSRFRALSRVPGKFDEHFQIAFSVLVGPMGGMPFSDNAARHYYTPEEFEYALHQALKYSDEYVWVFTSGCNWFDKGASGAFIARGYRDALIGARRPHPHPPPLRNLDAHVALRPGLGMPPRRLAFEPAHDEQATFGDLWAHFVSLADLSPRWHFRIDPNDRGVQGRWFAPDLDESDWFLINNDLPWDNYGYRAYDGYGWYRQTFSVPPLPDGRKVFLAFGAVAHGAEVYVNGRLAGHHNMDGWAHSRGEPWKKRFLIDVTDTLRGGQSNHLAVRVVDYGPWGGGIWKPVKLIAEK